MEKWRGLPIALVLSTYFVAIDETVANVLKVMYVCLCASVWIWVCGCGCVYVGVWMWVCISGCVDVGVYMFLSVQLYALDSRPA